MLHSHAPSRYQVRDDVDHSFTTGYASRAKILLQRSLDGGETWPREHDVVVWDESRPLEEKRAILYRADEPGVAREQIDLTSPDAAVYFTYAATGPPRPAWRAEEHGESQPTLECFAFRSGDRGRTWEEVPTRVTHPFWGNVDKNGYPPVQFPDGTLMAAMAYADPTFNEVERVGPGGIAVFGSDDNGLTWEYLAEVASDPTGLGRPVYQSLILLPSGRLQCYMLNVGALRYNAIQMSYSDDGGYSWSEPKPIVAWGQSPWAARRNPENYQIPEYKTRPGGPFYRSPWPI